MNRPFDVYQIISLSPEYGEQSARSLRNSLPDEINELLEIKTIQEAETRETTLNRILEVKQNGKDIFVFVDDILFEPGWWEILQLSLEHGEIIGFTMVDAISGYIQDNGYDLVRVDGRLQYKGYFKHQSPDDVDLPPYRIVDGITGCAMYIKDEVFEDVSEFPLDGVNRWGELLFSHLANKAGHRTIVTEGILKHYAISTKQKDDPKVSSMSWLVEDQLWSELCEKFFQDFETQHEYSTSVDDPITRMLSEDEKVLIYGCGTIAEKILKEVPHLTPVICSGMPEEIGREFRGIPVKDVALLDLNRFNSILITPIGYDDEILRHFEGIEDQMILGISESQLGYQTTLTLREISNSGKHQVDG